MSVRRTCGDCKACCIALPIEALNKPAGAACVHVQELRPVGAPGLCGRHTDLPAACAAFRCLWLEGDLSGQDRPDRSGLILWALPEYGTPTASEVRPGAADALRGREILRRLEQSTGLRIEVHRFGTPSIRPLRYPALAVMR